MICTRTTLAATIATLLLASCGGGGSDPAPVASPDTAVRNDQPALPAAPVPTTGSPSISQLYGRVSIGYSFEGAGTNGFSVVAQFGPENLNTSADGLGVLIQPNTATARVVGLSPAVAGPSQSLACSLFGDDEQVLCIVAFGQPTQLVMRFDPLENGVGRGEFRLCPDRPPEDCVGTLLASPDGPATIEVNQSLTAKLASPAHFVDLLPYLQYDAQGVPAAEPILIDPMRSAELESAVASVGAALTR